MVSEWFATLFTAHQRSGAQGSSLCSTATVRAAPQAYRDYLARGCVDLACRPWCRLLSMPGR